MSQPLLYRHLAFVQLQSFHASTIGLRLRAPNVCTHRALVMRFREGSHRRRISPRAHGKYTLLACALRMQASADMSISRSPA